MDTTIRNQNTVETLSSQPQQNNTGNQKRFSPIIIGLIILLLILGLGVYLFYSNNNRSQTSSFNQNTVTPTLPPLQKVQAIPNSVDKIAYITKGEVWVVNEDGIGAKKLLSHEPVIFNNPHLNQAQNKTISDKFNDDFFFDLSWSRDGNKLAVTGYSKLEEEKARNQKFEGDYFIQVWYPPHGDIYLVDVENGQSQVLEATEVNTLVGEINWSYDNKQIVFKRERPFNQQRGEIVLANTDASNKNEKVLTTYEYQGNNNRGLTWFPERGEVWFKEKISYHINNPEPSLVRFDMAKNQRDEKPVEVTKGYRLHTFSFLKDGGIMYFNTVLGPDSGTEYNTYEVRVSNPDGTNSRVVYTGKDCGEEKYRERCYYAYYSPDGNYAVGDVIYKPEAPEKTVSNKGGATWNKNGDKTAYTEGGINVLDMTTLSSKRILQNPNIREIKWAY